MYKHEVKMAKIMTLIVTTFLVCWMPLTIICVCELLSIEHVQRLLQSLFSSYDYAVFFILLATPALNSLIDPLIYAWRMAEVRKALWRFLKCTQQAELSREATRTTNASQTQPQRRSNLTQTSYISTETIISNLAAV
jgi:7 transmembrane receptor (rhodopsin family)